MDQQSETSAAAAALGRIKTARKAASSAANIASGRQRLQDEDVRAKLRAAQQARRQRERQAKEAGTA